MATSQSTVSQSAAQKPRVFPNFGRIGVLMGGLSSERPISLKSGTAVFDALASQGLDVVSIDINTEDEQQVRALIDAAHIHLAMIIMHGRFGEDGKIQAILDSMNIPYVGSDSQSSARAMQKSLAQSIFRQSGLLVPAFIVLEKETRPSLRKDLLSYPLVVKPNAQGSSIGVSLVKEESELDRALDEAFALDSTVLLEQYIRGKELTVGILAECPLEPIEIIPSHSFFDYQAKYEKGLTEYIIPARIDRETRDSVRQLALRAHQALGCRHFSRVDFMLDQHNRSFIIEINTIPGFTATSLLPKAAEYIGIPFTELCLTLLTLAYNDAHIKKHYGT